ncbi:MAG: zf-TFIIB domain-containing protein [Deltaproteobacteria bacterium]|nr:zf-TFIIB domain-containing protein [Deltaproteobacteria bacterium]
MQCPACKEISLVMTERQGIEVDYCPQCRGVWLDRGELDKIVERAAQVNTVSESRMSQEHDRRSKEQREYRDDDDDKYYGKGRKRKKRGFLGELFDFD